MLDDLRSAGHALAHLVIADRRFSDLYELGQCSTVLTPEAEIQRRLLPASYACEGPVTGGAVRDDATVLVIDWYGDSRRPAPPS